MNCRTPYPPPIVEKILPPLPAGAPTIVNPRPRLKLPKRPWEDVKALSVDNPIDLRVPEKVETIDDLVLAYSPWINEPAAQVTRDAWMGDRLLSFAVSIILCELTELTNVERSTISSEVCSNLFLSQSFSCRWRSMLQYQSVHSRGTVVEAALFRLWKARSIEPVLDLVRLLVSRSSRFVTAEEIPPEPVAFVVKPRARLAPDEYVAAAADPELVPADDSMPAWLERVAAPVVPPLRRSNLKLLLSFKEHPFNPVLI